MSSVPTGWKQQPLGEIAETQLGKMLNRSQQIGDATMPYLRNVNVQWGRIDLEDVNAMDIYPEERAKFTAVTGDLLVCEGGESGRAAIWSGEQPIGFQNALHRVRPKTGLDSKFLLYNFEWQARTGRLNHLFSGVTITHFTQEKLRKMMVSYPPLDVQQRIVETLEDHLSRLDKALADLHASTLQLKKFSRSSAHDSLRGKGRDSAEWTEFTLGDVATWSSGGTPSSKTPAYYGGDIPWAVIGDLTEGPVETTAQSITALGLEKSSAKIQPPGTVMLAMYGASIGRTGVATIPMATNQAIACAQVDETLITPEFLLRFLQNQKSDFVAAGQGGAQPNISQGIIKSWSISLPPLEVQREICRSIAVDVERVDRLSDVIQTQIDAAETLRRSLLHAAFTGQLTNEVSND